MPTSVKAFVLLAMGIFLYSRFFNGTLLFYINERFVWLTLFASVGLVAVAASYRYAKGGHEHHDHDHSDLSWRGLAIVLLPIILGLLIPPRPLGAAAMGNRDLSIDALTSASSPQTSQVARQTGGERDILDWLIDFRSAPDPTVFTGEEASLVGFVYRDDRFAPNQFMVSRFTISCCAADASPLGLIVEWPDSETLPLDGWVTVEGQFAITQFDGQETPLLIADSVTKAEVPDQPYLYP